MLTFINKTYISPLQNNFKVLDKLITFFSTEIKTYFSFPKKVTKAFETSNINIDEVDKAKTVKITKEDLKKSFELYEEKLVILA